jgi:hypothetical protein
MRGYLILVIVCVWLSGFVSHSALAAKVIIGTNITGAQNLSEQQQDALIEQLRQNGVTTIRTGMGDKFTHLIIRAYQRGIGAVVSISPNIVGSDEHIRPAYPALGLWAQRPISDADPEKFRAWLTAQLAPLEKAGVHLTAFELGNEINGPYFNSDFLPSQASGRVLGISDLNNPNDPEGSAINASYKVYLQVMKVLKDVRDHSQLNQTTPIISAGLADGGLPGKKPGQKLDGVSIPATIEFLRENGLDQLVDGYGVHIYPGGYALGPVSALMDGMKKDAFAMCTSSKPCWVTEWGFGIPSKTCPVNDQTQVTAVNNLRSALKYFADQGRLAASIVYTWNYIGDENDIFRCGSLIDSGRLALSPL